MVNKAEQLIQGIRGDKYQELLQDIYGNEIVAAYQKERYVKALINFQNIFGDKEVEIYSAPGRSEVGGNHTDHQLGSVLAASVNLDAIAVVHATEDNRIRILSEGYEMLDIDLSSCVAEEAERGSSKALVKGVAYRLRESGYRIGGFDAYITSDVLGGAGMSSSAAFEVLIGNLFSGLYNEMQIDPIFLAQAGQFAENVFFGKPCGLMDQMACSVGGLIYIDFQNQNEPLVKKLKVDFSKYDHSLCIVDTKGSHADLTEDYAAIFREMKQIASFFGEDVLRKIEANDFYKNITRLRELFGDRAVLRAIHFFEENERVRKQVIALENGKFDVFKQLIKKSGASSFEYLQNVYAIHDVKNQSMSIGLAMSDIVLADKGVSRVHGGGFAGTIQAFVPNDMVKAYQDAMEAVFGIGACHVLQVRKYGGMKVL